MPQLNPTPWFTFMVFTWLVFLTIMPLKILAHTFPNPSATQNTHLPKTESWIWPWY